MALFVRDPNVGVRCAAARFIGRMGERKTLPMPYALAVAKLLADEFDDAVREGSALSPQHIQNVNISNLRSYSV